MTEQPAQWYVATDKGEEGPCTAADLSRRLQAGELTPAHQVWREGLPAWQPISSIAELSGPAAPPAAPPAPQPSARPAVSPAATLRGVAPQPATRTAAAGRPRGGLKKLAGALLALILLAGIAVAGFFAWQHFMQSKTVDFASVLPPGARLYAEIDQKSLDPSRQATFKQWLEFMRKTAKAELPALDPVKLGYRGALAVYGADSLEGGIPAAVLIIEAVDAEAAAPVMERALQSLKLVPGEESENLGWKLVTAKKALGGVMAARQRNYLILTNSRAKLDAVLKLWSGEKAPSLAADANFTAAFATLDVKNGDRQYLDLAAIIGDLHPFISIFGGETYREIKAKYLDSFRYIATVGRREGEAYAQVSQMVFVSPEKLFGAWQERQLQWPAPDKEAMLDVALVIPPGCDQLIKDLIGKAQAEAAKSRLGSLKGKMGSLNAALAMYYADNNRFPVSPAARAVKDIGLVPMYIDTASLSSGEEFIYQGDGTYYTLCATRAGDTLLEYRSGDGRLMEAPTAAERLAEADSGMKTLIDQIGAIEAVGFRFFLLPGGETPEPRGVLALRLSRPEGAAALKNLVMTEGKPPAPDFAIETSERWFVAGTTAENEAFRKQLAAAQPRPGAILTGVYHVAMKKIMPAMLQPPDVTLDVAFEGKYGDNRITLTAKTTPDQLPMLTATLLTALYGKNELHMMPAPGMPQPVRGPDATEAPTAGRAEAGEEAQK